MPRNTSMLEKAHKKGFKTILQRFQTCEIYRNSQTDIGWTEEFCKHFDELAQENHSYVVREVETSWASSLSLLAE